MTAAKDLRAALVVVAVLLVSTLSASAQAIVVEGNRRVEADTIRSYFRGGPGDRLDAARIDQGLKALYATGLFQDVRISQPGGRLVVTVVEAQVINRVAFEGNKKAKDEQLSTEIQSKPRGTLSRATVQADVQRIIDIYRSNGRYDVRVEPKIIDLPNNRVDLVFEVNEGGKTGVKRIDFVGNRAYSNGALKDVIKTGESNLLSFLKTNDIYDPDRVEADRELLRRYYLKHGYADVRIVSVGAEFDPESRGFTIVFNIEEGEQYRFGTVDIQSSVPDVDVASLRSKVRTKSGAVYNAEAVERTVEETAVELAKRGYAFAQVRPRGDRDMEARVINLVFAVDEGARAYIERINVRGNTRTRDYVIRREFDIAEGDAYNRALMDRAERRLKNLNYFKTVKITNEPGSAPDRVVVNVEVEEQPTGEFSIAGGYSTNDGFISEVSVGERNLLGKGQYAKVGAQYGQRTKGFEVSFVEPYLLGYRVSGGIDVFAKQIEQQNFSNYQTQTIGGNLRMGLPLRDDLTLQLRYSVYEQRISLPAEFQNGIPTDGEASVAVKQAAANGGTIVSLVGYSIIHNTLDNNKLPTSGLLAEVRQDFAGVGGDVNFIRTTADARTYYEVYGGIVAMLRAQGGHVAGWGDKDLRLLDHFFMGPNLVRGFASSGIGPRDLNSINSDPIGGTMYWGTTAELQFPIWGLPKDFGLRGAVFADAGSVWDYKGQTQFPQFGSTITVASDDMKVRSAVGAGLIWESPFGPLRFDYAVALSKDALDKTQAFRFGGGTKF